MELPPAQIKQGRVDCGLFAIANAYELAAGNDPSDVSFDQGKMRKHLVQSLEKCRFEPFPRQSNTARFNKRQTCNINLFCYCSMPECWDDIVQYELCAEWFHMSCKRFKTATESEWLIDVDLHLKKELRVLIVQNRNTFTYHRLNERLCSKSSYFALVQKLFNVI